jgi:hypothetical protein
MTAGEIVERFAEMMSQPVISRHFRCWHFPDFAALVRDVRLRLERMRVRGDSISAFDPFETYALAGNIY